MSTEPESVFDVRNVLLLVGVLVATIGTVYFATEIRTRVSDGGRVLALVLLGVMYASLGHHFERQGSLGVAVDKRGWRWLRVTTMLYMLGVLAAVAALFVFLSIDAVDRLLKAGVAIGLGLALILVAAWHMSSDPPPEEEERPRERDPPSGSA